MINLREVRVPISKFNRESNKWFRKLEQEEIQVVIITLNGKDHLSAMSPETYMNMCDIKEEIVLDDDYE